MSYCRLQIVETPRNFYTHTNHNRTHPNYATHTHPPTHTPNTTHNTHTHTHPLTRMRGNTNKNGVQHANRQALGRLDKSEALRDESLQIITTSNAMTWARAHSSLVLSEREKWLYTKRMKFRKTYYLRRRCANLYHTCSTFATRRNIPFRKKIEDEHCDWSIWQVFPLFHGLLFYFDYTLIIS